MTLTVVTMAPVPAPTHAPVKTATRATPARSTAVIMGVLVATVSVQAPTSAPVCKDGQVQTAHRVSYIILYTSNHIIAMV